MPTKPTMGKSNELSMDLKKQMIDLKGSEKSLGAISKQLHFTRATVQTRLCKNKADDNRELFV